MLPEEFSKFLAESKYEKNLVTLISSLMASGLSHSDLFGEEILVKRVDETTWKIVRKGMPLAAFNSLLKFVIEHNKKMNVGGQNWRKKL